MDKRSTDRRPASVLEQWRTPDGVAVTLRPLAADDGARELRFLESLSKEARYERVFSHRGLLPGELRRLVRFDVRREVALAVFVGKPPDEKLVAVARLRNEPHGPCEFAIVVGDRWQHQGIGKRLLLRLLELARAAGIDQVVGYTRASNEAMKRLAAGLGFSVAVDPQDATVALLSISLAAPAP